MQGTISVESHCSFQPAGREGWSCIFKAGYGINATVFVQKGLLQNQDFRLVGFKDIKIISVSSGFYSLGLIHFI